MKVEIKIPNGWRRVRVGKDLRYTDKRPVGDEWVNSICERRLCETWDRVCGPYIRKIKKK